MASRRKLTKSRNSKQERVVAAVEGAQFRDHDDSASALRRCMVRGPGICAKHAAKAGGEGDDPAEDQEAPVADGARQQHSGGDIGGGDGEQGQQRGIGRFDLAHAAGCERDGGGDVHGEGDEAGVGEGAARRQRRSTSQSRRASHSQM